jgi:hypothetical protein
MKIPTNVNDVLGQSSSYGALWPYVVVTLLFIAVLGLILYGVHLNLKAERDWRDKQMQAQSQKEEDDRKEREAIREGFLQTIRRGEEKLASVIEQFTDALKENTRIISGCTHNTYHSDEDSSEPDKADKAKKKGGAS